MNWTARISRRISIVIVASLVTSLSAFAVPRAEAATGIATFGGFYRPDASVGGPASLDLSGPLDDLLPPTPIGVVTAGLTLGPRFIGSLAGTLSDSELNLAGAGTASRVLIRGRVRGVGAGSPARTIIEARYVIQSALRVESGAFVVVRKVPQNPTHNVGAEWTGATTGLAGSVRGFVANLRQKPDGSVTGSSKIAASTYEVVGQAFSGDMTAVALAGLGSAGLLTLVGNYEKGTATPFIPSLSGSLSEFRPGGDLTAIVTGARGTTDGFSASGRPLPPSFEVNTAVRSTRPGLKPFADGAPRPIARLIDEKGTHADFVENEMVVWSSNMSEVSAILSKWKGKLLRSFTPPTGLGGRPHHLIRIDPAVPDAGSIGANIRKVDPASRGHHQVSSESALKLLAATAEQAAAGSTVSVNATFEAASHFEFADRKTTEGGIPSYQPCNDSTFFPCSVTIPGNSNAFSWEYMGKRTDFNCTVQPCYATNIGVGEAWRALEIAGKLGNRVSIGFIDSGFDTSNDLPQVQGIVGIPGTIPCSGGGACPWHGQNTMQVAAAIPDNNIGIAGPAGPIADTYAWLTDGSIDDMSDRWNAADENNDIITTSVSITVPAAGSFQLNGLEGDTEDIRALGILIFAAAGNDSKDVDAEDCFWVCWEEEWIAPCENDGVVCVGGLSWGSGVIRHPSSNFGEENVDIWAPFAFYMGPDNQNSNVRVAGGTSFSAPFVAGITALIIAADPSRDRDEVHSILFGTQNSGFLIDCCPPLKKSWVNAYAAVSKALGNVTPVVEIDTPQNGAVFRYGGILPNRFSATAFDAEDGCCTYSWTGLGSAKPGQEVFYRFPFPGSYTVTARATDAAGATGQASITVTAINNPPEAFIDSPTSGQLIYRGVPTKLRGHYTDFNEIPECDALTWISNHPADTWDPAKGCPPTVTFTQNGTRTLTLIARDEYGLTDIAQVDVTVVDPPGYPIPTILKPDDGAFLPYDKPVILDGTALTDSDPVTYRWTALFPLGEETISTALDGSWTPPSHPPVGGQTMRSVNRADQALCDRQRRNRI